MNAYEIEYEAQYREKSTIVRIVVLANSKEEAKSYAQHSDSRWRGCLALKSLSEGDIIHLHETKKP